MVMNLTIWLPNGLKKIAFILTRRGESRSELQKIIWMAVCRNLENLENIGSNRKSVLRGRRTRRQKMAKFQSFQNSNRHDQNVGKVLISRKVALTNYKHPCWANKSLLSFPVCVKKKPVGTFSGCRKDQSAGLRNPESTQPRFASKR